MKHYKKTMTMLLTAAVLLVSVFMTGCTKLSEAPNSTPSEVDAPAESDGFGVYVKQERDDTSSRPAWRILIAVDEDVPAPVRPMLLRRGKVIKAAAVHI